MVKQSLYKRIVIAVIALLLVATHYVFISNKDENENKKEIVASGIVTKKEFITYECGPAKNRITCLDFIMSVDRKSFDVGKSTYFSYDVGDKITLERKKAPSTIYALCVLISTIFDLIIVYLLLLCIFNFICWALLESDKIKYKDYFKMSFVYDVYMVIMK